MTATTTTTLSATDARAVAQRLGVSRSTVRRLVMAGELDALRIGRRLTIPEASVAALIARGVAVTSRAAA